MATTIQVSKELHDELAKRKMFESETYEDVLWDLLEDGKELSEETKKAIKQAEQEIREGKTIPLSEVKRKLGL